MRKYGAARLCILLGSVFSLGVNVDVWAQDKPDEVQETVDSIVAPLMQQYKIPGFAVAVTVNGTPAFYNYGVMSKETREPVTNETLFELGSVSKTFVATLAAYEQEDGKISLSDKVGKYLPSLKGSAFGKAKLIHLGTHTAGGLPLQVPDEIHDNAELMDYLKAWKADYAPGSYRAYSNISIGVLGLIAEERMHVPIAVAFDQTIFQPLGMKHSFVEVPADKMDGYAQGYNREDKPVRVNPGVLGAEAYGIKSSSSDMIRFVEANMQASTLDGKLGSAIRNTHIAYFKTKEMTQDLIWEQFAYPVSLAQLQAGNSEQIIFDANPVKRLTPPLPPQDSVLINKTGSTNGFSTYVAYVPAKHIGVVLLTNKSYPIAARVKAGYEILTKLGQL